MQSSCWALRKTTTSKRTTRQGARATARPQVNGKARTSEEMRPSEGGQDGDARWIAWEESSRTGRRGAVAAAAAAVEAEGEEREREEAGGKLGAARQKQGRQAARVIG